MAEFGQQALLSMFIHLIFIGLTFWSMQALRFDKAIRPNRVLQARVLFILVSIAIGSTVANFFLSYTTWSQQLPLLF